MNCHVPLFFVSQNPLEACYVLHTSSEKLLNNDLLEDFFSVKIGGHFSISINVWALYEKEYIPHYQSCLENGINHFITLVHVFHFNLHHLLEFKVS